MISLRKFKHSKGRGVHVQNFIYLFFCLFLARLALWVTDECAVFNCSLILLLIMPLKTILIEMWVIKSERKINCSSVSSRPTNLSHRNEITSFSDTCFSTFSRGNPSSSSKLSNSSNNLKKKLKVSGYSGHIPLGPLLR